MEGEREGERRKRGEEEKAGERGDVEKERCRNSLRGSTLSLIDRSEGGHVRAVNLKSGGNKEREGEKRKRDRCRRVF